jgi:hypothetical protein
MDQRRPIADPNLAQSNPTTPSTTFTTEDYMRKVRRGDETSAGGLNGMNYSILKLIFKFNDQLAHSYTEYLNQIVENKAIDVEKDFLNASRGVGIPKNELGDMRPIAVGHILLRLLGSMAVQSVSTAAQKFFMPLQFGVGVKNGCELMINAISAHLRINPSHIIISCDSKNAFNSFDRSKIWTPLRQHFPSIERLVRLAYLKEGTVCFNDNGSPTHVKSSVGSRQGCSMGSFLFCLAIHNELTNLQKAFPDLLILAYCDDVNIVGPPEQAAEAYRRWSYAVSTRLQGSLRDEKGAIFSPQHSHQQLKEFGAPESMSFSSEGIKILGAPIGTKRFIKSFMEAKVTELEADMETIARMPSLQAQWILNVKALQHRLNYLFRCTACGDRADYSDLATRYDSTILSVLRRICHNHPLSQRAISIAQLPAQLGGLGIKSWFDTADPAFLASYLYSATILPTYFPHLTNAFSQPSKRVNPIHISPKQCSNPIFIVNSTSITPSSNDAKLVCNRLDAYNNQQASARVCNGKSLFHIQANLSRHCDSTRQSSIISSLRSNKSEPRSIQLLARFLSGIGDTISFNTTPSDRLTTLSNQQLKIAILQRILEPIIPTTYIKNNCRYNATFTCPKCNKSSVPITSVDQIGGPDDIDPYGFHAFRCTADGHAPRTKLLHDKLRDTWLRVLKSAGFDAKRESYNEMESCNKRPDISVLLDDELCSLFLDVRTCDPLLKSCFKQCCQTQGHASNLGAISKDRDWANISSAQGDQFQPICHEHPGFIGEGALALLDRAAARYATTMPQRNAFKTFWLQRIHLTNTRGTANLIISRMPFSEIYSSFDNEAYHCPFPTTLPMSSPCHHSTSFPLPMPPPTYKPNNLTAGNSLLSYAAAVY